MGRISRFMPGVFNRRRLAACFTQMGSSESILDEYAYPGDEDPVEQSDSSFLVTHFLCLKPWKFNARRVKDTLEHKGSLLTEQSPLATVNQDDRTDCEAQRRHDPRISQPGTYSITSVSAMERLIKNKSDETLPLLM